MTKQFKKAPLYLNDPRMGSTATAVGGMALDVKRWWPGADRCFIDPASKRAWDWDAKSVRPDFVGVLPF